MIGNFYKYTTILLDRMVLASRSEWEGEWSRERGWSNRSIWLVAQAHETFPKMPYEKCLGTFYERREKMELVIQYLISGDGQRFALQGVNFLHVQNEYVRAPRRVPKWEAGGTRCKVRCCKTTAVDGLHRARCCSSLWKKKTDVAEMWGGAWEISDQEAKQFRTEISAVTWKGKGKMH